MTRFNKMKKIFVSIFFLFLVISAYGERITIESYAGIEVSDITPQNDGAYIVSLYNANYYSHAGMYDYCAFTWYLSYKGQRVSDYYNSHIRCQSGEEKTVYAWPNEIPKGYEKYVTVQFGREQKQIVKDRRDDY